MPGLYCESQQSLVDLLTSSIFTLLFVVRRLHGDISIYLHCMMSFPIVYPIPDHTNHTIYFLKAYHMVMTMTKTKSLQKD